MTRRWYRLLVCIAWLAHSPIASAQVDFDAIRDGVAGCPELAADPDIGNLGAFLCHLVDRTSLDAPINQTGNKYWEVRAGSFHPYTRPSLLASARSALGDAEYSRLQSLLLDAQVLTRSLDAYRLALLAEGDTASADAILGTPESVFDANIPALLATRPDRNRYADLRSGLLHSLGARDTVGQFEPAFGETIVANIGGVPFVVDAEGLPVYTASNAATRANPFFLGPDGARDSVDDLPFVAVNDRALAAGYTLATPIQGALDASFDGTFGRNSPGDALRPIYSQTAQISVPSASDPSATKLVELYGVYSDPYLILQGCSGGFGTFDTDTAECSQSGVDVTSEALARGCEVIVEQRGAQLGVGVNADGSCIEVNTNSPAPGSQLQFEVIGLLGDPAARPLEAIFEPVDLTDLRMVADGGEFNTLPARPRAYQVGNISFPVSTTAFRRSVDFVTGAPIAAAGASVCRIQEADLGVAVGPNLLPGDGDDVFPSGGYCMLWDVPDSNTEHHRLFGPADVAARTTVNQSLFHSLCSLSFDADLGFCSLDDLNFPPTSGLLSNALSGLGVLASVILDGVETIQPVNPDGSSDVVERGSNAASSRTVLPIEPLALQAQAFQDLGLSLRSTQAALLGCGPGYASPCSPGQQSAWNADPVITAALTRNPVLGPTQASGIDLMNADASVFTQEFVVVKQRQAGALVGATRNESGQLTYLPGVNFSRTGQQALDLDQDFDRQGVQLNVPPAVASFEPGDPLPLTPNDVIALGSIGRAQYQTQAGNLREADGWVESMPWKVDPDLLDRFGAIVFKADPNNPLDLDSPRNDWNLIDGNGARSYSNIDGEYCARWMNADDASVATPFNLGCTALETLSANLERIRIGNEVIGQDRVFDAPESLEELVALLDGDPSNDATGDPIAGPDGIFARNQFVLDDDEMDFEVVAAGPTGDASFVAVPIAAGEDPKLLAAAFLADYDPQGCASPWCYLEVNNVLVDPDDARANGRTLILAMPIAAAVEVVTPVDPDDPNSDYTPAGFDRMVNLAGLQFFDLPTLRRLLASRVVPVPTPSGLEFVRMSTAQRNALLGEVGSPIQRGRDMDGDQSSDLDRNRDGIWDGQDDHLPGPVSDDAILCGSSVPGDLLQDGVQFSPYRADQKPGQASFDALFPDGLPPRSAVFCRTLNATLGVIGPVAGASDAFLWHGGAAAPGSDDDADGFPDVVDSCATIANADQSDIDTDGVGDVCDNCVAFPNPRVPSDFLAANPWATVTGGQRDDDRDGFGNACDGDFDESFATTAADTAQFKMSLGHPKTSALCGTSATRPCAIFDLNATNSSESPAGDIDELDTERYKALIGSVPGPSCAACPLICASGDPGNCD